MAFITAHFAHEKDGVEDDASHEQGEEGNTDDKGNYAPPVENDPTDIEDDSHPEHACSQNDEEHHVPFSSADAHGVADGSLQRCERPWMGARSLREKQLTKEETREIVGKVLESR
jgi:hypothetical protein